MDTKDKNIINKSSIMSIIVSFNPTNSIYKLASNVSNQVGKVVIVDNCSNNVSELESIVELDKNISLIKLSKNYGISKALNVGINEANIGNYQWVLTLDQDSLPDKDMVENLIAAAQRNNYDSVCPVIEDGKYKKSNIQKSDDHQPVSVCITSGQLTKLSVINSLDAFNEDYFIDNVDFDFCLKLKNQNYKLGRSNKAKLNHNIGYIPEKKYYINKFHTYHPPIRRYYIYRNFVFLLKSYLFKNPLIMLKLLLSNILYFINILILGERRFVSFAYIISGLFHGLIGKKGKL